MFFNITNRGQPMNIHCSHFIQIFHRNRFVINCCWGVHDFGNWCLTLMTRSEMIDSFIALKIILWISPIYNVNAFTRRMWNRRSIIYLNFIFWNVSQQSLTEFIQNSSRNMNLLAKRHGSNNDENWHSWLRSLKSNLTAMWIWFENHKKTLNDDSLLECSM